MLEPFVRRTLITQILNKLYAKLAEPLSEYLVFGPWIPANEILSLPVYVVCRLN